MLRKWILCQLGPLGGQPACHVHLLQQPMLQPGSLGILFERCRVGPCVLGRRHTASTLSSFPAIPRTAFILEDQPQ